MSNRVADGYKSLAQRARVITEDWAGQNLFCPNCAAERIQATPANTRAVDFQCSTCAQQFQLKGKSSAITNKVLDGAYETMLSSLKSDSAPNLFLLQYDRIAWTVVDLVLVPHFALSPSALEQRRPLGPTARRAGWIGCFIVLSNIPPDARIPIVRAGKPLSSGSVREQFQRLKPLQSIAPAERGWTLDVFNLVRGLGRQEFSNADIYAKSWQLAKLHPQNRHITDKIRQQLQFLRNAGLLFHVERGRWRLCESSFSV